MSLWAALGSLLIASGVGLHLEGAEELSPEVSAGVLQELSRSVARGTGRRVVVDEPEWPPCHQTEDCIQALGRRLDAEELLLVRLLGGPTLIRVVAVRASAQGTVQATERADLPRDPVAWGPACDRLRALLFPGQQISGLPARPPPPPPPPPPSHALSWVLIGAGAAAVAVGVGLRLSSASANEELGSGLHRMAETEALESRLSTHATASSISWMVGGAAAAAGVALLLID